MRLNSLSGAWRTRPRLVMRAPRFEMPTNKQTKENLGGQARKRTRTTAPGMPRGLRFAPPCGDDGKPLGSKTCSPVYSSAPVTCASVRLSFQVLLAHLQRSRSAGVGCNQWLFESLSPLYGLEAASLPSHLWPLTSDNQQGYFIPWRVSSKCDVSYCFWPANTKSLWFLFFLIWQAWRMLSRCWMIGWLILCVNCPMNIALAGSGQWVWKWLMKNQKPTCYFSLVGEKILNAWDFIWGFKQQGSVKKNSRHWLFWSLPWEPVPLPCIEATLINDRRCSN